MNLCAKIIFRPGGGIEFVVKIPRRPSTWLVGAFALSNTEGLSFTEAPARVDKGEINWILFDLKDAKCKRSSSVFLANRKLPSLEQQIFLGIISLI